MKQLFREVPNQTAICEWIDKICVEFDVPYPTEIVFKSEPIGHCDDDAIILPSPEWITAIEGNVDLQTRPARIWLTVMHETAHWIVQSRTGEEADHRPQMYQVLLGLYLREGLPLDTLWKSEHKYKPGSLARGMKLAGAAILDSVPRRHPVDGVTQKGQIVPFPALPGWDDDRVATVAEV